MLSELIIKNIAIIDRLQVAFGAGFNVLTGETGAGKSIIIDAVGLLLGDRARPELIRSGEEEAVVEALFDLRGMPGVRDALAEAGLEEGDELVVKRSISRSGRNRVYLNGSLATLGQLQPLAGQLMTIYGQHASQGLQRADLHLDMLDSFAGLDGELGNYRELFRELRQLNERLQRLDEAERERQHRLDLLGFQSSEIAAVSLKPGEDADLAAERLLLQNAGKLAAATEGGYELLYAGEGAACERLGRVADDLAALSNIDPQLGQLAEAVRGALFTVEDVAEQLRGYAGRVDFEPGRQDEVESRLALISGLKRKYAPTLEEILAYKEKIDQEIEELSDVDAAREGLRKKIAVARQGLERAGAGISARRAEAARQLAGKVELELRDLAMAKARFEVRLSPLSEPGPTGLERGEFFLAPNPGEEPKPLARIASGGELSRIMLALKRAAPGGEDIPCLIFDEVDAGIGGEAATAVGEKLRGVAVGRQVLCITHLPQVAAYGDRHYRVEKREEHNRTVTRLVFLENEERVREMARMLGGARVTERTLEHARELIAHSLSAAS
ncbi:DNA repair protein RecN [Desulfuromonas versatilis]|uniref:DNA repair protein RecN n=1 Tax=Desulfuromonas versatilis TaxID=2802975 RepID=A0ABN6DWL6_9BACT|nr:DNA repair protein RecN [Desulfuromonas versatilis]BCR04386.1 DNA repair protein RecN [Desulfuromonas versatilis]